jgi:hypothetical protein
MRTLLLLILALSPPASAREALSDFVMGTLGEGLDAGSQRAVLAVAGREDEALEPLEGALDAALVAFEDAVMAGDSGALPAALAAAEAAELARMREAASLTWALMDGLTAEDRAAVLEAWPEGLPPNLAEQLSPRWPPPPGEVDLDGAAYKAVSEALSEAMDAPFPAGLADGPAAMDAALVELAARCREVRGLYAKVMLERGEPTAIFAGGEPPPAGGPGGPTPPAGGPVKGPGAPPVGGAAPLDGAAAGGAVDEAPAATSAGGDSGGAYIAAAALGGLSTGGLLAFGGAWWVWGRRRPLVLVPAGLPARARWPERWPPPRVGRQLWVAPDAAARGRLVSALAARLAAGGPVVHCGGEPRALPGVYRPLEDVDPVEAALALPGEAILLVEGADPRLSALLTEAPLAVLAVLAIGEPLPDGVVPTWSPSAEELDA